MAATLVGELAALMDMLNDTSIQIVAHLGKNAIPSGVETITPDQLVECDFPGYEPIPLNDWRPIFLDDENYGEADAGEVEWSAGAITVPQNITCVYVSMQKEDDDPQVWNIIVLPEPEMMTHAGDLFWFSFRAQSANLDALPDVDGDA